MQTALSQMSALGQSLQVVCRRTGRSPLWPENRPDSNSQSGGTCFSPSVTELRSMAMQDQVNATPAPKRVPWNKGKLTDRKHGQISGHRSRRCTGHSGTGRHLMLPGARGRADTLCPSLYHRVTSRVPSGGNRSAILTGNLAGTFSSGYQHRSDKRELLT